MTNKKGFFAYSASPKEIGISTREAINHLEATCSNLEINSWEVMDVAGQLIATEVLSSIDKNDFFIADISCLNFNVTYEIGYAIGKRKPILLVKNGGLNEGSPTITEVGIFDTIGYETYQNSTELAKLISNNVGKLTPINIPAKLNKKLPVYLLEPEFKSDWATRIVARIKKSKYFFRSFDPNEQPRLSTPDAIDQVSQSIGVVVPLLSSRVKNYNIHNMRGAFIAGLADGMGKVLCLLQDGEGDPIPIDFRDFVEITIHPNDINDIIADFAGNIAEVFQSDEKIEVPTPISFLKKLDLGSSSAENEMRTLQRYYLRTDQFLKSIRGEAHLIVGRKGSGKSAIFLQVRDRERNKAKNIVLDLKPEGYKLIKFKELILNFLQEGTFQHTVMAFWEYVLLLEICYKILEKDREQHMHDHNLYEAYRKLSDTYHTEGYITEGDFSERMSALMERITTEFNARYPDTSKINLSVPELTQLLYMHDVKILLAQVTEYLQLKDTLWLLFDNIDKGWPTSGLTHEDLLIIRALVDATRKLERDFDRRGCEVNTLIFLRNDVYELLVKETSDRGKEANVLLDWTDGELLKELVRLRLITNGLSEKLTFSAIWPQICVSHYKGEESFQFLVDRSLMRPRFLLNLINQCKSFAVNLNHEYIETEDITKGLSSYSTDLLVDIGYEIRDLAPEAEDSLYAFIGSPPSLSKESVQQLLLEFGISDDTVDKVFELLLWYGFLGLRANSGDIKYIYDLNYNMQLIHGILKKYRETTVFIINPAFWPALMINDDSGQLEFMV